MRVVLPGEADAAEHLHAVLGVLERGVERERERGRRRGERDASPGRRRRAPRPTPRHARARPDSSMSAQWCFTPWNCPIGRPNCTRSFAYSAAVSTHHCATPDRVGRDEHRREVDARARASTPVEHVRSPAPRPSTATSRDPSGGIDARAARAPTTASPTSSATHTGVVRSGRAHRRHHDVGEVPLSTGREVAR